LGEGGAPLAPPPGVFAVTGAFGYTGRHITRRLLAGGRSVLTLTGHPERAGDLAGRVEVHPLDFNDPRRLTAALQEVEVLFNTYWIRFERGPVTFDRAVASSRVLFLAAAEAGVRRIVHISITNPSEESPLPYFRGKALVERALRDLTAAGGPTHAIIRPTVMFGGEDILLNNIAWLLRRFPLFPVLGRGDYPVQPVHVDDVAALAVALADDTRNVVTDAVGPETFPFRDLVALIRRAVGSRAVLLQVPPDLGLTLGAVVGRMVRDVILTRDEVRGLMAGLLVSASPPTGTTRFSTWLRDNAVTVGRTYRSELARHYV